MNRKPLFIAFILSVLLGACSSSDLPYTQTPQFQPPIFTAVKTVIPTLTNSTGKTQATLPSGEKPVGSTQPQPSDENLTRGEIFLDEADVLTLESFPPQFMLGLAGMLPTPCHQLRVNVPPADKDKRILVEVYSVVDPQQMCAQVLAPFQERVPLTGLSSGSYLVFVNDQEVGSITVP